MLARLERVVTRSDAARGVVTARYGLEGALLAVAAIGAVAWLFGYPQQVHFDLIAGFVGFSAAVAGRIFLHRD